MRAAQRWLWALGLVIAFAFPIVPLEPSGIRRVDAQPAAEMATVAGFTGSDKLLVRDDDGLTYRVQYIGVRGPVGSSAQYSGAAGFHGPLVIGKRVLLEGDGQDQVDGYRLRHVYLGDDRTPLGATVLAAGWATAVPYPAEHRHRALYLRLQEAAMADRLELWRDGVLGPVAPWRPSGSAMAGSLAADPGLHAALDLLYTVPTGREILDRLLPMTPTMLYRDLPYSTGGLAVAHGYLTILNRAAGAADPRILATFIAHEGTHLVDFAAIAAEPTGLGCFELEQRAHRVEATVWREFFGTGGKSDPRDAWEHSANEVLRFAQRGDLDNHVRRSSAYEAQCAGDRATAARAVGESRGLALLVP